MAIKGFYPESEIYGKFNKHGLEGKMVEQDVVPHADVQNYARYIIGNLNQLKKANKEEQMSFVIDAFNAERLLANFFYSSGAEKLREMDNTDKKSLTDAANRIRKALMEELKGKVDDKVYLVMNDIIKEFEEDTRPQSSDSEEIEGVVMPAQHGPRKRNIIGVVENIGNGVQDVYKDQQWRVPKKQEAAMALFSHMIPHPNIVKLKEYDQKTNTAIYEKLNIESNLAVYGNKHELDFFRHSKEFAMVLQVLNDCIGAALHLENNGLVLQDIKLTNIGVEKVGAELKGVLFDLEGLIERGKILKGRIYSNDYFPPEAGGDPSVEDGRTEIGPKEMVFQFGICLQKIFDICVPRNVYEMLKLSKDPKSKRNFQVVDDLKILTVKMTEKDPVQRIDLRSAQAELAAIIKRIKESAH